MFTTRKKKRYQTFIFSAVIVALCLLVVAVAWPAPLEPVEAYGSGGKSDAAAGASGGGLSTPDAPNGMDGSDAPAGAGAEVPDAGAGDGAGEENETGNENDGETGQVGGIDGQKSSYYLVKRAGETIQVYFCQAGSEPLLLETTEILYALLGPADQALFDEGIKVDSQEALSALLQDFES